MYVGEGIDVEESCYDYEHIQKVLGEIKKNFEGYFQRFLETNAGNGLTDGEFTKLQKKFGIDEKCIKPMSDQKLSNNYKVIIEESLDKYEKDKDDYLKIMDMELLEDLVDDADYFKSKILKNECPIIRKTLANRKAKELDKYRGNFRHADADWLLQVVTNLCEFADEYAENYDEEEYESHETYEDLNMSLLDTDDYTAYGVIGGGIKTHMLYKVYPGLFPNRSRSALWALWYLSGKTKYDCTMDSEFLMIDVDKNVTQQNYFYPYTLFVYYAFEIYKLLRDKAVELNANVDPDYRYVIVDAFLEYVALEHDADISFMKSQIRDGGIGLA
ncbi:MAG: hypothetical protein NC092_03995 [Butyrivibrio sp.]|nr:hypothetical protein [Muribaculum sp.]MCM1551836.1 hypothetical protein [Butyrivibrio sp.]